MKKLLGLGTLMVTGCAMLAVVASAPSATLASRGRTTLESVSSTGQQANLYSWAIGISARARYVVFSSDATNLVPHDTNNQSDAFVRDRKTGRTTRVSVSSSGAQAASSRDGFGGSRAEGINADGRFVVFVSDALNLVRHDTNGVADIFVRDRETGRTTRVSVSSRGRQANAPSGFGTISADGRYVAFDSTASNLVPHDTNHLADVFVHDRLTGRTERVSLDSRGRQARCDQSYCESVEAALSANGRYVAFVSSATNLVPHDTNHLGDVFVRDRKTGRTTRVSVTSSGKQGGGDRTSTGSNAPAISADGRYVAFHSADSNLVPGDTNRTYDIFVHDRVSGRTERVSVGDHGQQANAENLGALTISANGRYVAFASFASNLVPNEVAKGTEDLFIRDRAARKTILAIVGADGAQASDSAWPAGFSANARYLVFGSWAGNLVPNDVSPGPDVFVRDFGGPPGQ
jgi:Tol biopolymer transport system component